VQVAVVLIASSAMIGATIVGAHAAVHIVTERLSPRGARIAQRVADALSALTFILFAIGSAWVASDLWNGHERTELLLLPLRWFRLLWIVATLIITVLFARAAFKRTAA
jgi:TRAP-type C4-dicarboxylate transport system permease small subunit